MTTVTDVEDALPYEDPTNPYQEAAESASNTFLEDAEYARAAKDWPKAGTLSSVAYSMKRIAISKDPQSELDAEIEHYQVILDALRKARLKALIANDKPVKKAPAKPRRKKPSMRRKQLVSIRTKDALGELLPLGEANIAFTKDNSTQLITVTDEDMAVLGDIMHSYLQGRGHAQYSYWM